MQAHTSGLKWLQQSKKESKILLTLKKIALVYWEALSKKKVWQTSGTKHIARQWNQERIKEHSTPGWPNTAHSPPWAAWCLSSDSAHRKAPYEVLQSCDDLVNAGTLSWFERQHSSDQTLDLLSFLRGRLSPSAPRKRQGGKISSPVVLLINICSWRKKGKTTAKKKGRAVGILKSTKLINDKNKWRNSDVCCTSINREEFWHYGIRCEKTYAICRELTRQASVLQHVCGCDFPWR